MNKNEILIRLSESENVKFGKVDFAVQSFPQKVFSAVWCLESEVNNGGFSQYFVNDGGGESASFVVEALQTIGALKTADICKRAVASAFPTGLPDDPAFICSAAAEFPEEVVQKLEHLDSEFFAYPNNLTDLLFAFVSGRPEEFGKLDTPDTA